jgi:hypothetical protein
MDVFQAAGLAHPVALMDVGENGNDLLVGQAGLKKTVPRRSEKVFLQWGQ